MFNRQNVEKASLVSVLVFCLVLTASALSAQDSKEKDAIYQAGLNYVEGFYGGDSSRLKESLSPSLKKFGFWKDQKTGKFGDRTWMTFEEALKFADDVKAKKNFAKPDAPKKVEVLDFNTKIALVKISAWWGVDYMLLSNNDGKWTIGQVIWEGPGLEENSSETDKAGVERAALNYIEGFYEGDSSKLRASLKPDMYKFGYGLDKKSGEYYNGSQMTFERAIAYADSVKEKKTFPDMRAPKEAEALGVMNQIAVAKVTAWWGIDYMLMTKDGDKWMIEQILWSGVPE